MYPRRKFVVIVLSRFGEVKENIVGAVCWPRVFPAGTAPLCRRKNARSTDRAYNSGDL